MDYQKKARDFLDVTRTKFKVSYYDHAPYFPEDKQSRDIYTITLRRDSKQFKFKFGQSIANQGQEPTAYSVLACLTKYDPGTFGDFCGDYGFDEDSHRAERTYKAVCREWRNVERLFSDVIDELREIQ